MPYAMRAVGSLTLALACGGGTGDPVVSKPVCPTTFTNPVATGADPWVTRSNGSYYFIESRDNGIWVYKTDTLTSLKKAGVKVWSAPSDPGAPAA